MSNSSPSRMEFLIKQIARCIITSYAFNDNDFDTRASMTSNFENELERFVNLGNIVGFQVWCNDVCNTPKVIDNNSVVIEYFIGYYGGHSQSYRTTLGPNGVKWEIIGGKKINAFDKAMKGI